MLKIKKENPWDQVAINYKEEVISPIYHSIYSPLEKELKQIKNKTNKTVADFGCGTGPLLPLLSKEFKTVHAVDYSKQMLKVAYEKMQNYPERQMQKISFHQGCLTNLKDYKGMLDVAMTINSVIMTDFDGLKRCFKGLYDSLKKGGSYIAILPALEAVQEEFQYTYQQELKKYKSHDLAYTSTRKKLDARRINFELGTYNTGDMFQKYFTSYELKTYLRNAGFKNIRFDQVIYDEEHSYNYHDEDLSHHPAMWDHFLICEK